MKNFKRWRIPVFCSKHGASGLAGGIGWAVLAGLLCLGCSQEAFEAAAPSPSLSRLKQPIVGGDLEPGWPGVGALTIKAPGAGQHRAYCTGALIASRWVLTAAHCLGHYQGVQIEPAMVKFYLGGDTTSSVPPLAQSGRSYQAEAFLPHSNWTPQASGNDIGLIRLAEQVLDISPYPLNSSVMNSYFIGRKVRYVGFGANQGLPRSGGGIKRSGDMDIHAVYDEVYVSDYKGTGICFGDSGGPGFMKLNGEWRIVGVNTGIDEGQSGDACAALALHTRVDAFARWLNRQTGALPAAGDDPGHDMLNVYGGGCSAAGGGGGGLGVLLCLANMIGLCQLGRRSRRRRSPIERKQG